MDFKFNKTKIIATTGPASSSYEMLLELVNAGVNVFRLNFSHSSYDDHQLVIDNIHKINKEHNLNIAILADLQGPKLRIGELEGDKVTIDPGEILTFTTKKGISTKDNLYITYPQFPRDVKAGERILIDDGKLELEVTETNHTDTVKAKVIHGGTLSSKKGVNLPNTKTSIPSLTKKDLRDLEFILDNNINWLALSFVRSAKDIHELKDIIDQKGKHIKVIAKIEKPEAIEAIDDIIDSADAIMVARGDLGVEVPMEEVPLIQKSIVSKCILQAKPVIIATQIMETMILNPNPTRAEVTDVANAVIDGADALMLSGETSVGKFPVKVITTIEKIIENVEKLGDIYYKNFSPRYNNETYLTDAICYNACNLAKDVKAKAIIAMTRSGYTGFVISSYRPNANIFLFTDNRYLLNMMSLTWGVRAFFYDKFESTDVTIQDVKNILKEKECVHSGDTVINLASMPMQEQGRTNMIKVSRI